MSYVNLDPAKYWSMNDAAKEFVRLAYLLLENHELKVPVNTGLSYAVQIEQEDGFQTCWYIKEQTLEAAQKEAARLSRKRKTRFRVVRFDILRTIVEPVRKTKKRRLSHA